MPASHQRLAVVVATAVLSTFVACDSSTPTSPPTPAPAPMTEPPPVPPPQPVSARYSVVFEATWSSATHPVDFPSNPHFSPLVGGTHRAGVRFWGAGDLASEGIERMAEMGRTSPLDSEIQSAIGAGLAQFVFVGGGIGSSPATTSLEFAITQDFPRVTLVSMVAPSPDWFVGVADLPLFAGGTWVDQIEVRLSPWDAGTDDGITFTSPDADSQPRQPIALISRAPLAPKGRAVPLGTFTFRRIS